MDTWFLGKWQNSTTNEKFEVLAECKDVLFINPLADEKPPFTTTTSEWMYSNHREGTADWQE